MAGGDRNSKVPECRCIISCPIHTGTRTAYRPPIYNACNCPCAQAGTDFRDPYMRVPRVPLCEDNLAHLEQMAAMQAMNINTNQYPQSWMSAGTDMDAINIDEGCPTTNGRNNGNNYLQMTAPSGTNLNEAQHHLRASEDQNDLRMPILMQRYIQQPEYEVFGGGDEDEYGLPIQSSLGMHIVPLGPTYIIPPSGSVKATRGYPSTGGGRSSVKSVPGSGSGGGSGHWSGGEISFAGIGAQYPEDGTHDVDVYGDYEVYDYIVIGYE